MLVTELKRILEIDTRINAIHRDLAALYEERLAITANSDGLEAAPTGRKPAKAKTLEILPDKQAAHAAYGKLAERWRHYGITVPSLRYLERRLKKASQLIRQLDQVAGMPRFDVLLVPPSRHFKLPIGNAWRDLQTPARGHDYISHELLPLRPTARWQVLVTSVDAEGLRLDSPRDFIDQSAYKILGHDSRGLGILEYTALTLQFDRMFDQASWSLLFKEKLSRDKVACVQHSGGNYRFNTDDMQSVFGDNSFRPAILIV